VTTPPPSLRLLAITKIDGATIAWLLDVTADAILPVSRGDELAGFEIARIDSTFVELARGDERHVVAFPDSEPGTEHAGN
jgi:hypothetical protein